MEPPVGADADALRDEKVKVCARCHLRPEPGRPRPVPRLHRRAAAWHPDSDTETFVALQFEIDSWRWAGVPWLIRAGKNLPRHRHRGGRRVRPRRRACSSPTTTPPRRHPTTCASASAPTAASCCSSTPRRPASGCSATPVDLEVTHDELFGPRDEPYERLLEDAMEGDPRRFGRADASTSSGASSSTCSTTRPGAPLRGGHAGARPRPTTSPRRPAAGSNRSGPTTCRATGRLTADQAQAEAGSGRPGPVAATVR